MIRTNNETVEKFKVIAEEENRSMSNLGEYLIKRYIKEYESEYGEIKIND
ncbi:ribbon-helix-helix domain-containing protein [[Clostridium] symbiosum]|jgi:hypothetical protein|nr:hypothetical protein [[Clostridium] symbiosum]